MKLNINPSAIEYELPEGFFYVGLDNYYITKVDGSCRDANRYVYSDSATSSIVVIVEGRDEECNKIVALGHFSRPERLNAFFDIVADTFSGCVNVFAQGANPSEPTYRDGEYDFTSLANEKALLEWINSNIYIPTSVRDPGPKWFIKQTILSLGLASAKEYDNCCYGINLDTMTISNKMYELSVLDREPAGGVQTLYTRFGMDVTPQIVLHNAADPFTEEEVERLVEKANAEHWTDILKMTPDEVLENYSATPDYEAPWYTSLLMESAAYVSVYNRKKNKIYV